MTGKQAFSNGDGSDSPARQKDELDHLTDILQQSSANEILDEVNAGLGNYDDDVLWSQTESYRKGLIAHTAVSGLLIKRTIDEAKKFLAEHGTSFYSESEMDVRTFEPYDEAVDAGTFEPGEYESSWNAKRRYAEEIWKALGQADKAITQEQRAAMVKATGMEPGEWIPMFWDMFAGKHDMSRSHGAELLKLYLGDHYTFDGNAEEEAEQAKSGILRRRS